MTIDDPATASTLTAADAAFLSALGDDDPAVLYEQAPCGYLSMLPDGVLVKVNQTLLTWTGRGREELLGRRFVDLLPPGDRIFYEAHLAPLLRLQGQAREFAVELVTRDGGRLPVLVTAQAVRGDDGEMTAVRVAVFDATERRSYERELVRARQRAEAAEARAMELARTLQTTLLPLELDPVPGVDLGAAYRPAGDGTEVGGDFYDLIEAGPGRWTLVLGDVCGKGARAALLTALARFTLRSTVRRARSPRAMLAELHEALLREHPDQFCTALLLGIEPQADGAVRVVVTSGGHPLPLHRRGDGTIEEVGRPGGIVGLVSHSRTFDVPVTLAPGDLLVAWTDGITEAKATTELFGEERLREAIEEAASGSAQDVADHLVDVALAHQGGHARDDIAVVALRPAPERA
ncbi:MAG: PP2C family protein-serine/threonine phosphatase [Actinomycetota bacterium]